MSVSRPRPLLQAPVAVEGVSLLRATLRLWPDRLEVEGRFRMLRPYRQQVALADIKSVEWNAISDVNNLVVHLTQGTIALMMREAATWKFAIEAAMGDAGLPTPGLPSKHFREKTLRHASKLDRSVATPPPTSRKTADVAQRRASAQLARTIDLPLLLGATVHALQTDENGSIRLSLKLPGGVIAAFPLAQLELRLTFESDEQPSAGDGLADRGDGLVGTDPVYEASLPTLTVMPQA